MLAENYVDQTMEFDGGGMPLDVPWYGSGSNEIITNDSIMVNNKVCFGPTVRDSAWCF